jgi:twitching motility protein PilU
MQPGMIRDIAYALMNAQQIKDFESTLESNFAIAKLGIGRFRINVFKQRGEVGMVIRHIKTDIPTLDSRGCPRY